MVEENKAVWLLCFIAVLTVVFSAAYTQAEEQDIPGKYFISPPPFSPGIFPCSQCHQGMPANKIKRKLSYHENIVLKHMSDGWCFDCHNPDNRDKLRLANGKLIKFEDSYILCGQCHGTILREWKAGLHGKRTGMWNGDKEYYLCVSCHWPHEPRFKQIKPLPPPVSPGDIK